MAHIKNSHSRQVIKNSKGQISIFFGVTLMAIFSFIAFVVNVGLFVKAKINMQNSVDSAAWSGAAVQARQLTNIAHLNWEMRNTYKEWMFKYYVLGQLANESTHITTGDTMDFTLKRFDGNPSGGADFAGGVRGDHYNIPSICLHFGAGNNENLCTIYQIPGLPRFHVAGIPDVSEEFEATLDAFVNIKAKNCMVRSTYNFAAAMNYAFASGTQSNDIPIAAANRTGAWIESTELALRMRNLEMILNRPPITEGICGQEAGSGCQRFEELANQNATLTLPLNERPLKAYIAGLKSLSGGSFKNKTEFANSFVLYELAPKPFSPSPQSLSSFLIPTGATHIDGQIVSSSKSYVDLVPMILNFTTFFTSFAPTTEDLATTGISSGGTFAEASCASTKTAFPVPGYILGFYKNPKVVTYYAVKGKARYHGLLNPFRRAIEISAYAAAKPFGGRIGPALVSPTSGTDYAESSGNSARIANASGSRSANYIMGFSTTGDPRSTTDPSDGVQVQGLPLPATNDFFLDATDTSAVIGGNSGTVDVKFTIPNMIYNLNSETTNESTLPTLAYNSNILNNTGERAGLFTKQQYLDLRKNIPGYTANQAGVSSDNLMKAFMNVRAPTNYDLLNYLVPTLQENQPNNTDDHFPTIRYSDNGTKSVGYFAPLFHSSLLYADQEVVKGVIGDYIDTLGDAVIAYRKALQFYATKVANTGAQQSGAYAESAKAIYDNAVDLDPSNTTVNLTSDQCATQSIASRFTFFLMGDSGTEICNILPLKNTLTEYVSTKASDPSSNLFYYTTFLQNSEAGGQTPSIDNNMTRTAYAPGKDYGGSNDGRATNPFSGSTRNHRRNAYSTKLIAISTISDTASGYAKNESNYLESVAGFSPEGETPITPQDIKATGDVISNPLPTSQLSEFGTDLFF